MFGNLKRLNFLIGFLDLALIAFLIFDFGFVHYGTILSKELLLLLPVVLVLLIFLNIRKYWISRYEMSKRKNAGVSLIILIFLLLFELLLAYINYEGDVLQSLFDSRGLLEYGLLGYFLIRLTFLMRFVFSYYFNPAILFIGSYLIAIISGTFLLMLPSATMFPINFSDALFTATSAVCVNGLLVLEVGTDFTTFGQSIILGLIQLGGLGMLTFTSFFAYFFKSGGSFKEGLLMKDFLGGDQLNNIMQITMRIVVFSLIIEGVGALLIYDAIKDLPIENPEFFAIFHTVSAYTNAGFSTLPDSFQGVDYRFNYYLQWVVMGLIIFGGLGYFISFNFIKYIKQFTLNLFRRNKKKFLARLITLNTKIVVYTTIILIFFGTFFFLISEYNSVLLADDTFFGKWTTAMFSSVTARTCGYTTVDYTNFTPPGLLIMIFLMWIGASPGSTGGGIKTSSFALATLNIFSTARNKPFIEIGTRRVSPDAVRRAFAIIIISLISISSGILLLLILNPEFTLIEIVVEIVSSYSTTGISLGITPYLSTTSRYVVIFMMFFGRIGLINLMAGMLKDVATQEYEYPKENILIN